MVIALSLRAGVKVNRLQYLKQYLAHGHMLCLGAANQREASKLTPAYSQIQSCGLWTSKQDQDCIDTRPPTLGPGPGCNKELVTSSSLS